MFNEGVQLSVVTQAFSPSTRGAEAEARTDFCEFGAFQANQNYMVSRCLKKK